MLQSGNVREAILTTRKEFQRIHKQQKKVSRSRFHYFFFDFIVPVAFITCLTFFGERFGIDYDVQLWIVALFALIYGLVIAKLRGI